MLRGDPPIALWSLLQVSWQKPAETFPTTVTFAAYRAEHDDVDIEFRPQFSSTFVDFKIDIDQSTGMLTVRKPAPPEPILHNFILEAVVTRNGPSPVPLWAPALRRVHVHQQVRRIWMTPSRLSIPRLIPTGQSDTIYRFTVRAQFDDDTVADITSTAHYSPDAVDAHLFYTSADERCVIRIPDGMGPGSVRRVSMVTTPAWNSRTAHADIAVLEPLETATDIPRAELIDAPPDVWEGKLKPEKKANIAFLGSGFRPLDLAAFEQMTNNIVHQLRTGRRFLPYAYFAKSVNFWRIFVPASEAGICVRCEVFSFESDGQRFALPVPAPRPLPKSGPLTLNHLVYMFGLPVPSDLNFVLDTLDNNNPPPSLDAFNKLDLARLDFSPLRSKWRLTKRPQPELDVSTIELKLVKEWMSLANRTFIDEIDCFPSMAAGTPPSAEFDESASIDFYGFGRDGNWHSEGNRRTSFFRRVAAAPRNGVVTTLENTGTETPEVGALWGEDRTSFTFDNRPLLVVVPNMAIGRSIRFFGRSGSFLMRSGVAARMTNRLAATRAELGGLPVAQASGRNALTLAIPPLSSLEILPDTWEVIAHELGHSFGLGDEYTAQAPKPQAPTEYPNLMQATDALNSDKTVKIEALKWNWHRIRKASVITLPSKQQLDGMLRVFVARNGGHRFARGDKVRFRARDPRAALSANPVTSATEFAVEAVHPNNLGTPQDLANMTIVLRNPTAIDVSAFGPGSLIYLPIAAPEPVLSPTRPYLTLVSPAAERIMAAITGTMSGKDCDVTNMEFLRARVQLPQLPLNDPLTHQLSSELSTIVGAYFGGAEAACEVLHPAGSCIMRTGVDSFSQFCPVCRYALVDLIDPEQHWQNDRDYDTHYFL